MENKVFVDMDGVLCDFMTPYLENKSKSQYPQSKLDFFLDLKPIEGAIESFALLESLYDVYILSSPSIHNPHSYTEKRLWVERHLGFKRVHKLILSKRKDIFSGIALIDDRPDLNEGFNGEFIHFGSDIFPDWNSVIKHLVG